MKYQHFQNKNKHKIIAIMTEAKSMPDSEVGMTQHEIKPISYFEIFAVAYILCLFSNFDKNILEVRFNYCMVVDLLAEKHNLPDSLLLLSFPFPELSLPESLLSRPEIVVAN